MINWPSKTPAEFKDYGLNWAPALSKIAGNPTITNSSWSKISGDASLGAGLIQPDARRTAVKIGAGSAGGVSIFRNQVTLSDTQVLTCDALVRVRA